MSLERMDDHDQYQILREVSELRAENAKLKKQINALNLLLAACIAANKAKEGDENV